MKFGKPETKPYLMQAIYNLTNGSPGAVAMRDDVLSETFNLMGVDPDSLGTVSKGAKAGTRKSDKLVSACFSELKKEGKTHSPLRNRYALTDAGLSDVASTQTTAPIAPTPEPEPAVEVEPEVVEAQPEPVAPVTPVAPVARPKKKVAKKPEPIVAVAKQQSIDDYILGLMVQSSPCYGVAPSSRAKTCKNCPLFAQCNAERNTRLMELAQSLESQAARLEVIDLNPAIEEVEPEVEVKAAPDNTEIVPIEVDGVQCEHCHQPIQVGDQGAIVPDLGMFHVGCVSAAVEAAQVQKAAAGGI